MPTDEVDVMHVFSSKMLEIFLVKFPWVKNSPKIVLHGKIKASVHLEMPTMCGSNNPEIFHLESNHPSGLHFVWSSPREKSVRDKHD